MFVIVLVLFLTSDGVGALQEMRWYRTVSGTSKWHVRYSFQQGCL